jgi:hypothetical protein
MAGRERVVGTARVHVQYDRVVDGLRVLSPEASAFRTRECPGTRTGRIADAERRVFAD